MNIFSLFVSISFCLWGIRNLFFWVGLWQDKEYRLDRLFVHFRETVQGRHIFLSIGNGTKWAFLFLYGFIVFHDRYINLYEVVLGLFFIMQSVFVLKDVFYHRIKRPIFTLKAIAIVLMSSIICAVLLIFPFMNTFLWLLFIDRFLPFVVALFIFFFAFPTEIYQDIKISQARNKMKTMKNVLVIAVSGSYGKTSTKEYIAQVLSQKFQVVKTPGSNNTPFGIANTILHKVKKTTEIFVVEMGAYKRGEIAMLTHIVRPEISVTTAISDQHISLYGSLKNVIESEYELIRALPKNGLAIFNGNSEYMTTLLARARTEKIIYQYFPRKPKQSTMIGAYNVHPTTEGTTFTAVIKGESFICKVPLYGTHVVENILPAIFLAQRKGFTKQEIIDALSKLESPAETMIKKELKNGALAMDDTFNASPESVFSAMEFLNIGIGKKVFVLAPLTELGKQAKFRHYQIGKKASVMCDALFLLNKNFSYDIFMGIAEGKGKCQVEIAKPEQIAKLIKHTTKKGDMIIFEGKESKMVLNKLL